MLKRKNIKADLCVVGAGIAGICAAIAAAREGKKVVLMHERPVVGGNASPEVRMCVCGAKGENNRETGIVEEIQLENLYRNPSKNYYVWGTVLHDFILREKNITLLLNCTCMDAVCEEGAYPYGREKKIQKVTGYQMTTQTMIDVEAAFYADCSGDSILAPLTGAEFRMGREAKTEFGELCSNEEADERTMGNTCLLQGRETDRPIKFTPPTWAKKLTEKDFENREPNLRWPLENFWYLELGGMQNTIDDAEEISQELLALSLGTWDYIKNNPKSDTQNWELEFLGFMPGKRESRRMVGEYMITQIDICEDKQFDDIVAYGGWPLDDHFPGGFYHRGVPNTDFKTPAPYGIPYRCLYSKNVDNLFFAGRNISATHMAMSSTRVMATCGLMGQAVGNAVSIAVDNQISPNGVYENHMAELQANLMAQDCFLPGKSRKIAEVCKNMVPQNGSAALHDGMDRANRVYGTSDCGVMIDHETPVSYTFDAPQYVKSVHLVFDSDLMRETIIQGVDEPERRHGVHFNVRLDSAQQHMPTVLAKAFTLTAILKDGSKKELSVEENRKRAYHMEIKDEVQEIVLTVHENWGETNATKVVSFDFE